MLGGVYRRGVGGVKCVGAGMLVWEGLGWGGCGKWGCGWIRGQGAGDAFGCEYASRCKAFAEMDLTINGTHGGRCELTRTGSWMR